uniref:AIG1-type G domain-containing protein n=1 Tax=Denticeps clupeoides TaxID=299321 RepID=A0AAY4BB20_9TELE
GSGKSSCGNTILRKTVFQSYTSSMPVTKKCEVEETVISGIHVRVIDTPDFFADDCEQAEEHTAKCRDLACIGRPVYILVMQLGRFTEEEHNIVEQMKKEFGNEVTKHTVILFTHKEELRGDTLKNYVRKTDRRLQELIRCCGSRYCAFSNSEKNKEQVSELIQMIVNMQKDSQNLNETYPEFVGKSAKRGNTGKKPTCPVL